MTDETFATYMLTLYNLYSLFYVNDCLYEITTMNVMYVKYLYLFILLI